MSEKITWTHVDRHVRQALARSGTLAFGETDAEVAMGYIAFLERSLKIKEQTIAARTELLDATRRELAEAKAKPIGKTKQRLAALELAVIQLVEQSAKPIYGPRGQCKVLGCEDPATTPDGHCDGHAY